MSSRFVPFDDIWQHVVDAVKTVDPLPDRLGDVYIVRNLYGHVRISVSHDVEGDEFCCAALRRLAGRLNEVLGSHGAPAEEGPLFVSPALLESARPGARKVGQRVYFADRLVTSSEWSTVRATGGPAKAARYTLYSIKGGVGRSTTAAVLAWHLARAGQRVLVVDLDLESPGLSSAALEPEHRPDFGVTDWLVEALVGQEDHVVERMMAVPRWARDLDGDVRVVPAHGRDAGDYLAKLGRAYMDTADDPWTARLHRLLGRLEEEVAPDVVILESRSGLHDIAAATVTDLEAQVLLFSTDSPSNWTDYEILFRHWQQHDLAPQIRERLSIVSALTPELDTANYLRRFEEASWDLFRDHLYDDLEAAEGGDGYSFDLHDDDAPHGPLVIHWTRGLAAGASLSELEESTVGQAYASFLRGFDGLRELHAGGKR